MQGRGLIRGIDADRKRTLEKGLGPDFTPEVKAAWTETYTALAGVMTAA